jgi:catalase
VLRSAWLRAAVVLAVLAAVLAWSIVGISGWLAVPLAVLAGWLIASVLYVTTPVVYGRALGILTFFAAAIALLTGGPWRWLAAVPLVVAVVLLGIRWRGVRAVDAVPRDRTLAPFLFDDGDRLVDTLDAVWGSTRQGGPRHGLRAAHSHGSVAEGSWERDSACGDAPAAALFKHRKGTVVARFSNFRGEKERDDARRMAHGLALELRVPGEASFAMVLVDVRRFPVATKEDFVVFTNCTRAGGLRKVVGLANLVICGRTSIAALFRSVPWRRVNSYAERTYHGLNTFYCVLDRNEVPVRYRVAPVADGAVVIAPATVALPQTRLDSELQARLRSSPVRFSVELVLGRRRNGKNLSADRVLDPTRWWGKRREKLRLCTVTLDRFVAPEERDGLFFQPFDVPVGIRPSDDEILSARRTAYATSYLRRCPLDEVSP